MSETVILGYAVEHAQCNSIGVHAHNEQMLQVRCGGLTNFNEGLIEAKTTEMLLTPQSLAKAVVRAWLDPHHPRLSHCFMCGNKTGLNPSMTPVRHRVVKVSGSELKSVAQPLSGFGVLGK